MSAPIRCLHYLPAIDLREGGVVRAVIDLIEALGRSGMMMTLLTHDPSDCPPHWAASDKIQVVTIPPLPLLGLYMPRRLQKRVRELFAKQDVIHLHTPWLTPNRILSQIAQELEKPYILSIHGMLDDWSMTQRRLKKTLYLELFGRRMLERAAFVHCTAEAEKEQSRHWYPKGRPCVIPCVIDLSPFDPPPKPDEARETFDYLGRPGLKLLFLSRLHPKKGLDHLLRACGELTRRGVDYQLGIAGPGDDDYIRQMKELASSEKVAERCHFIGMISGGLKRSLYVASDLFVLPTSQENFGMVFPEALLCRTPVLTTKGVDIWRELETAGATIVSPQPLEIANAVQVFAAKPRDELRALGEGGRDSIKRWLDPDLVLNRYRSTYMRAIALAE